MEEKIGDLGQCGHLGYKRLYRATSMVLPWSSVPEAIINKGILSNAFSQHTGHRYNAACSHAVASTLGVYAKTIHGPVPHCLRLLPTPAEFAGNPLGPSASATARPWTTALVCCGTSSDATAGPASRGRGDVSITYEGPHNVKPYGVSRQCTRKTSGGRDHVLASVERQLAKMQEDTAHDASADS